MRLSVIICTRNRAKDITGCLNSVAVSLSAASLTDAEIVVVDNGSTDQTSALVQDWAKANWVPVNLQYEGRTGLSRARNRGLRTARGDFLILTDDDCRLDTDYIGTALRYDAADTEPVLRGGKVVLGDPSDLPVSIRLGDKTERWQKDRYPSTNGNQAGAMIGANMMMRKTLANQIGFFDERFGGGSDVPGGEETDYIFRAYFSGVMIEYVPDLIVHHFHGRKDPAIGHKLIRDYSMSTGALYFKHFWNDPNLFRQLYWHVKDGVREWKAHTNTYRPEIDFTHLDRAAYCALGIGKYCFASAKRWVGMV